MDYTFLGDIVGMFENVNLGASYKKVSNISGNVIKGAVFGPPYPQTGDCGIVVLALSYEALSTIKYYRSSDGESYTESSYRPIMETYGNFRYYNFYSNGYGVINGDYLTLADALSAMDDGIWVEPEPGPVSVPITYYPTGCVLQGPSEAEHGDTVNVLVTPGPGKVIKPESIQVYDRSGLITHTYASGILSFDVPDG